MIVLLGSAALAWAPADLRDGDLVFHHSDSAQSVAIAEATGSEYTHVGVVLHRDGKVMVLEAVEPVRFRPIDAWVADGSGPEALPRRASPRRARGLAPGPRRQPRAGRRRVAGPRTS